MPLITPFKRKQRPVYLANFYSWDGTRRTPSLGTTDEREARQICLDLDTILSRPENQTADPLSSAFSIYRPRAVRLAFDLKEDPVLPLASVEVTAQQIEKLAQISVKLPKLQDIARQNGAILQIKVQSDQFDEALKAVAILEAENSSLKQSLEDALKELREYKRKYSVDVKVSYLDALPLFQQYKATSVQKHTLRDTMRVNTAFAEQCGAKPLPEITAGMIDNFIAKLKGGADTKRKARAYISTFWTWARKEYQLPANPMELTDAVKKAKDKEVECIRDEGMLRRYLDAHSPELYWHTWVSFACLTGCSWQDTADMEWKNINNEFLEIAVIRNKTGVFRRTPIESTYLKPLLKKYTEELLDRNQPYLFPTPWSRRWDPSTWHSYYKKDSKCRKPRKSVVERLQTEGDGLPWQYGPDEWRHQGATTLGHCGFSSLQISQWIGNSEAVCRKHYIAHISATPWSFKYV